MSTEVHYPNYQVANQDWSIHIDEGGRVRHEDAQLAVLMDIRAELRKLNRLLHCDNFVGIPRVLEGIKRNTTKKRRKK